MRFKNNKLAAPTQESLSGYQKVDRLTRVELEKNSPEKQLGFWEKIKLRIRGRFDGKAGLPAADSAEAGLQYSSPFLFNEARAYNEWEAKIWGHIQADLYPIYARALVVIDDMRDCHERRQFLSDSLPPYPSEEELSQRQSGEANLPDQAVKNRRLKSYKRDVSRINNEIASLILKITDDSAELSELYSQVLESEKAARILCESRRDRVHERVAVYWRSALRWKKSLTPTPAIDLTKEGEELYDSLHEPLHGQISQALTDKYTDRNYGGKINEN